jgi:hypothetical protein
MLKPNNLPSSDNTLAWAATLTQSPEAPSDFTLALLIQYQRLLECVFDLYREERKTNDWSRLAMHAKRMAAMLETWWVGVPPHLHLTRMDTLLAVASHPLIDDRSFRQQIPLRENTHL